MLQSISEDLPPPRLRRPSDLSSAAGTTEMPFPEEPPVPKVSLSRALAALKGLRKLEIGDKLDPLM